MKKVTDIFPPAMADVAKAAINEKFGGGSVITPNVDRWLRGIVTDSPQFDGNYPQVYMRNWQQKNVHRIRRMIEQILEDTGSELFTVHFVAAMPEIRPALYQINMHQKIERAVYGGNIGQDSTICERLGEWAIKQVATYYVAAINESN